MRALRIRDENAPPQLPAGKTIHQRNKSTPALSTLMQVGGLKAAGIKRTVFADVSNTVRQPVVKDDMQVPGKSSQFDILKDPAVLSAKELVKPTGLLRPAQRPLANITTKSNASNGIANAISAAPKHNTTDATNLRKPLLKKATTVFKESHSDPIAGIVELAPAAAVPTRQPLARAKSCLALDQPAPSTEPVDKILAQETAASLLPTERYIQDQLLEAVSSTEQPERITDSKTTTADTDVKSSGPQVEFLDALEEQARVIEQGRDEELAKSQMLTRLDLEEYWDEEEEEEYFDADGYTTARSLRSRGDTTGGVTLVLAPRITAKSQRELEAAKLYVETHKSAEDIEDEQWDTSMVAEYGEEIFEYMRDLEVRSPLPMKIGITCSLM